MTKEEFLEIQVNQARASQAVMKEFDEAVAHQSEILESSVQLECVKLMEQDGWRALRTNPVSDRGRGKGFGEIGMADYLFIRHWAGYRPGAVEDIEGHADLLVEAQVLWVEFKRPRGGVVAKSQIDWHNKERARGALTVIASQDFAPTVEGFREWYAASGLMWRARWW